MYIDYRSMNLPLAPPFDPQASFTFQILIYETGNIAFNYLALPFNPGSQRLFSANVWVSCASQSSFLFFSVSAFFFTFPHVMLSACLVLFSACPVLF
jgi:hypothetical protein